ncbi:MAG: hypothetical protein WEA34_08550 [Gemmatimonadota bacterium]
MLDSPLRHTMLLFACVFLSLSALRWHEAAVAAPDVIAGVERPSAVLLVQPGDCPDRTAAMTRWLVGQGEDGGARALPVSIGVLGDGPGALPDPLAALPRLGETDTRTAARAVLRAGIPGTPALIIVDGNGAVLLADTFEPRGPGPRIMRAAALFPRIAATTPTNRIDNPAGR